MVGTTNQGQFDYLLFFVQLNHFFDEHKSNKIHSSTTILTANNNNNIQYELSSSGLFMPNKAQEYETQQMNIMYGMNQEEDENDDDDENRIIIPIAVNHTRSI